MNPAYKRRLRVYTAILGFAGLAVAASYTRALFHRFELWKFINCVMALPGAVMFLYFAFHRERTLPCPVEGDDGGNAATTSIPWPAPTKPPSMPTHAEATIPKRDEGLV